MPVIYSPLVSWSEETAALGRERQKSFLSYALRMIRENFIHELRRQGE
ncbi:MAG: hypothetical protein MZV63_48200 [Marinilabiliales bacterium]|nr:hypothetical protein [Marinilabiliales bacterium]